MAALRTRDHYLRSPLTFATAFQSVSNADSSVADGVTRLGPGSLRDFDTGRIAASPLIIVNADTVVSWHRAGFRLFWRLRSRRLGRPKVSEEIRQLIRRMKTDNPRWGAPRIHGELLQLSFHISEPTVSLTPASALPRNYALAGGGTVESIDLTNPQKTRCRTTVHSKARRFAYPPILTPKVAKFRKLFVP